MNQVEDHLAEVPLEPLFGHLGLAWVTAPSSTRRTPPTRACTSTHQPDARDDIKLFVKLPRWFEIDTPVGKYNPDGAILKQNGGPLNLVRETKGTRDFLKLRSSEADKVRCGQKHFEALGVPFAVAVTADDV